VVNIEHEKKNSQNCQQRWQSWNSSSELITINIE